MVKKERQTGFTIVELLIVVVVIAILAAITVIAYNGISQRAKQSAAASAASQAAKKVLNHATDNAEQFPGALATAGVNGDTNTVYEYSYDNTAKTYCITATFQKVSYYVSNTSTTATAGLCPGHSGSAIANGAFIQTITSANCPTARTRAVDARDNHTYWVQKLADNNCWMLTNLAYAGDGVNTYNDVIPTGTGTGGTLNGPDNAGANIFTAAKYYAYPSAGSLYTTEPTNPSTDGTGGGAGAGRQYGYFYNWCAAMGAQTSTAACANATTPLPNASISICPAGWRLPTQVSASGEYAQLNTAINSGSTTSSAGLLSNALFQYTGYWSGGSFMGQGGWGYHWSSSMYTSSGNLTNNLTFSSSGPGGYQGNISKVAGVPVRCVAN